ncbi:hypothetical protein BsWGS_19570 [Bradybaena similaris]
MQALPHPCKCSHTHEAFSHSLSTLTPMQVLPHPCKCSHTHESTHTPMHVLPDTCKHSHTHASAHTHMKHSHRLFAPLVEQTKQYSVDDVVSRTWATVPLNIF